jgi:hypothetical protein
LFEGPGVVLGRTKPVLHTTKSTPCSSLGAADGELKATNLLGMIQLISPFSICS